MISRKRTTIAILRDILGQLTGAEGTFAAITGMSVSWIKKASSGSIPLTTQAAQKISLRTGVSVDWLLGSDLSIPPVESDNLTPYTRESYERYVEKSSIPTTSPQLGIAQSVASILMSYSAATEIGKEAKAANTLWECSRLMEKYGLPKDTFRAVVFATKLQGEIQNVLRWKIPKES